MFTAYKTRMEAEGKKVRTGGGFSGTGTENYTLPTIMIMITASFSSRVAAI